MSFAKLLNKTCVIQEKAETQTGLGELTLSWSNKATGVKTRYMQVSQSELLGSYQLTLEDYKFYFEADTDVLIADRIVVDSKTFEVKHVATDSSEHNKFAIAKLIQFD